MQPSLVLSCLALATFLQSSEIGLGKAGRDRAIWLKESAESALARDAQEAPRPRDVQRSLEPALVLE